MIEYTKRLFIGCSLLVLEIVLSQLEFPEEMVKGAFLLLIIWACYNMFWTLRKIKREIKEEYGEAVITELSEYQTGAVLLVASFILALLRSVFGIPLILLQNTFCAFLIWSLIRAFKMFKGVAHEKLIELRNKRETQKDDHKED